MRNKDFRPILKVLEEEFEIPQLGKKRRITALLPHDYEETEESYPVLYLQDGQNLFDENAPYGNWGIDKSLALLAEKHQYKIIVIAIDHGEKDRIKEYTPFLDTKFGAGDGKKYVRFVTDRLKPYVDKNFRTLSDREHTGIGGSSMGGLISIYSGLIYPEVYGKMMIFSPSLWVVPNIHFEFIDFYNPWQTKLYLYAGGKESENHLKNVKKLQSALSKRNGKSDTIDLRMVIDPVGEHKEYYWAQQFPQAVEWLFFTNFEEAS
jgi:predicted alpha/beta superfamily hydrolase